ncbi:unnamed protein product [Ostreobium quekettii]|uniref:RRM domain-containing protein n=1 Tax=Ostreobium quekettii TaxID=121088 RepID=A0A8S1JBM5_9CHLO|nr:unnamed protein product [Ostreobium quekettii]|eukprot:evm.model.scf_421.7 EVM.evm.TU.scf_421.7   scf_421:56600-58106(-)
MASKQDCKVFVGGLSWETTDQKLRMYFENWGNVTEAFVSYDRNTGRPRGFGFVVFEDPAVADKVVVQQHTIDRREVEAKKAVPKEEHQAKKSSGEAGSQRSKKVFVGGLAPSVDEKAFREYFEQYGPVKDAVVMYDHENKRPRGFGFVTFVDEDAVAKVFANGVMQTLHDKKIEIKHAVPRDQMAAQRGGAGGAFGGRGFTAARAGAAGPYYHTPQYGLANPGGYGPRGNFPKYSAGRGSLLGAVNAPGAGIAGAYRGMGASRGGVAGMGLSIGGGMGRGMGQPMGGTNMGGLNNMQASFASSLPAYGSALGYGGMNSGVLSFPGSGNGINAVGTGGGFPSVNGYGAGSLGGGAVGGMAGPGPQEMAASGINKAFGGLSAHEGAGPGGYAQFSQPGLQGPSSAGLVVSHETEMDARTLSLGSNAASATSGYKMLDEGHAFTEGPAHGWSN